MIRNKLGWVSGAKMVWFRCDVQKATWLKAAPSLWTWICRSPWNQLFFYLRTHPSLKPQQQQVRWHGGISVTLETLHLFFHLRRHREGPPQRPHLHALSNPRLKETWLKCLISSSLDSDTGVGFVSSTTWFFFKGRLSVISQVRPNRLFGSFSTENLTGA